MKNSVRIAFLMQIPVAVSSLSHIKHTFADRMFFFIWMQNYLNILLHGPQNAPSPVKVSAACPNQFSNSFRTDGRFATLKGWPAKSFGVILSFSASAESLRINTLHFSSTGIRTKLYRLISTGSSKSPISRMPFSSRSFTSSPISSLFWASVLTT